MTESAGGSAPKDVAPLALFLGIVPGVATVPEVARCVVRGRDGKTPLRSLAVLTSPNAEAESQTREVLAAEGFEGRLLVTGNLDEVLAAAPDCVLVEDLLEANPRGSRHLSRRQDVEELRACGIAVAAAVAVTQLRAAREVVRHHTGILPRNTLPDSLLEDAAAAEVIDAPPAAVLERRRAGEVRLRNLPEALCSPEALGALRELAFDITRRYRTDPAHSGGLGGVVGKVLVLLTGDAAPERLIQAGHRLAQVSAARWVVAHGDGTPLDADDDALRLAGSLGAEIVVLDGAAPLQAHTQISGAGGSGVGRRLVDRVLDYAHGHHVTDIVVGRPTERGLRRLISWPLADRLSQAAGGIAIHMIGDPVARLRLGRRSVRWGWRVDPARPWYAAALAAIGAVGAASAVIALARPLMPSESLSIIMLLAVLWTATAHGLASALAASVLGVVAFNLLFLPPALSFTPLAPENPVLFGLFAVVGGLAANLSARLHAQAATARRREHDTGALLRLAREIATAPTPEDVLKAVVRQLDEILGVRTTLFLPPPTATDDMAPLVAAHPVGRAPTAREAEALAWVAVHGRPAGLGTGTFADCEALFWPLRTPHGPVGAVGVDDLPPDTARQPQFRRQIDSLAGLAAMAIERMMLSREIEAARFTAQTESLRSALLSSISHDLRTPLASIIGSATSLLSFGRTYDDAVREDLLRTVLEEAERLNRFVGNLLQMTKLESGAIVPKRQWIDADDLIATTLDRMERRLRSHEVRVEAQHPLPPLNVDFVLMENVLTNLLDNAVKYSPPGSTVTVRARRCPQDVFCLEVADQGIGIAPEDHAHVFDKFFRVYAKDAVVAGTGLGLAICKGIVESHGGSLELESPGQGLGSTFRIRLPIQPLPQDFHPEGADHA